MYTIIAYGYHVPSWKIRSLFLKLGHYVSLNLAKDWLSIVELCRYDTALANYKDRKSFVNFLTTEAVSFHGIGFHPVICAYLDWLLLRKVSVSSLILGDVFYGLNSVQISDYFPIFCAVRTLSILPSDHEDALSLILHVLKCCPKLENLSLNDSKSDSLEILNQAATTCPHLTACNLSNGQHITDSSIQLLILECRYMRTIDLINCYRLTDESIVLLTMSSGRHLRSINLSHIIDGITDVSVLSIANECPDLTALNLTHCRSVTDYSVKFLLQACAHIADLNLSGCEQALNNSTLAHIAEFGCSIHTLNISRGACTITDDNISDGSIHALCSSAYCSQLITILDLSYNTHVTLDALQNLLNTFSALRSVSFHDLLAADVCLSFQAVVHSFDREVRSVDYHTHKVTGQRERSTVRALSSNTNSRNSNMKGLDNAATKASTISAKPPTISTKMTKIAINDRSVSGGGVNSLLHTTLIDSSGVLHKKCAALTSLTLSREMEIRDVDLAAIAKVCRELFTFSIMYGTNITDSGVCAVLEANRNLSCLSLFCCYGVSDDTLFAVVKYCPDVTELCLSSSLITDASLLAVAETCTQLHTLRVNWCDALTVVGVGALLRGCKKLRTFEHDVCMSSMDTASGFANADGGDESVSDTEEGGRNGQEQGEEWDGVEGNYDIEHDDADDADVQL